MRTALGCGLLWLWAVGSVLAQASTGRIAGTVVGPDGRRLPGATVTVTGADATRIPAQASTTDARGGFEFGDLAPGTYAVRAELAGFAPRVVAPVAVTADATATLRVPLALASIAEVVEVVGSTGAGEPIETEEIEADLLRVFQLPSDRFQEILPLLPGVVRDPRGRLSFNGTRPSQSALLVNGANATDPVTGQFAVELPLSVVDTVEVHAIPYSAEFGRVSGAVADVRTRAGDDDWDVEVGGLIPTPRFRDGTFKGINTATPRTRVSGPLRPGRLWLSQALDYRFVRSRVRDPLAGEDEEIVEGFDAFTQVDWKVSDRHALTATFSVFPSSVSNRGINALTPARATPTTESDGWNLAVSNQLTTGPDTLWRSQVAIRGFTLDVRPQGGGVARLTPDGLRDNYFNTIERDSRQIEAGVARTESAVWGGQRHLITVGGQLMATSFDGIDRSGPIEVHGADGGLLTRITFEGRGVLESSDVVSSGYVQDHWQLNDRLALDLGVRFDHDAMIGESHVSPRTAFSLALDDRGYTVVKGGWGIFFDHVFLQVDSFRRFQTRVEQRFLGSADRPAGPPVVFENRVAATEVEQPISKVWNLELDRQIGARLMFRVNYRENRATDRLVVERVLDPDGAALLLAPTGALTAREFDATMRWTLSDRGDLYVSYSKIRAAGDLNDFGEIYDTVREPLLLPNEYGAQPFEVANRVLLWGFVELPGGFTLTPGIEWRDGFPYTIFTEGYGVVGVRGDAQFPPFLSADLAVTKRLALLGRETDLTLQVYNLGSHYNPRDVVSNLASAHFGAFRNSVDTSVSVRVGFGL